MDYIERIITYPDGTHKKFRFYKIYEAVLRNGSRVLIGKRQDVERVKKLISSGVKLIDVGTSIFNPDHLIEIRESETKMEELIQIVNANPKNIEKDDVKRYVQELPMLTSGSR
jgi:hypothetical protein